MRQRYALVPLHDDSGFCFALVFSDGDSVCLQTDTHEARLILERAVILLNLCDGIPTGLLDRHARDVVEDAFERAEGERREAA
jgi:hypothetical protein